MNQLLAISLLALLAPTALSQNVSGVEVPPLPSFTTDDAAAYGRELAYHSDLYGQGWVDEVSSASMTLHDGGGDSVRRTISRMSLEKVAEGDKIITKFVSPAEIKGVTALTHENPGSSDDNWLYLPSNQRVRRISGANNTASFQGTEFTYEDLANLDPREYEWRFLEETTLEREGRSVPVFRVDAKPTYEDTGYSRIVLHIHREHWRHERIEYFDKAGKLLKTRESTKWKQFHGRFWREQSIVMENHQTGKRTALEQSKQFLNLALYKSSKTGKARKNLRDEVFTTQAIQR